MPRTAHVSCTWLAMLLLTVLMSLMVMARAESDTKKLIVLSLDGFGQEYLAKYSSSLKNLLQIYSHGSHPKRFINQFVTKTFPNHFSVATGLYEESHGVVANTIYDPDLNKTLQILDEGFFTQNPGVVPLWTLNQLHGGHSGCIMWAGCSATFHGQPVTYYQPYKANVTLREEVDMAVEWMTKGTDPANLVFIYHDQPDVIGHMFGPNADEMEEMMKKIDDGISYLFSMLKMYELLGSTDVIILSDHGMMEVPQENLIDLDTILDPRLYHHSGTSPVYLIWPKQDQLTVYKKLLDGAKNNHYQVYVKDELPSSWHYKANARLSPIVLLADDGYVFQDMKAVIDKLKKAGLKHPIGDHGYPVNTTSMQPIFVSAGPSFRRGFASPSFSNVDVYPLVCQLLSLPPGPTNGTLTVVKEMLAYPVTASLIKPLFVALGCLMILIGVIGILACMLARREQRVMTADNLINGYVHRKTMRENSRTGDEDASEEEHLLEGEVVVL